MRVYLDCLPCLLRQALEAARANELLESGQVIGNIVLLAPELL